MSTIYKSSVLFAVLFFFSFPIFSQDNHDLNYHQLASVWDEGIPLGNGNIGTLIWGKKEKIRFSLDKSTLWDERPMKGLDGSEFSYQYIIDHARSGNYAPVQEALDVPYNREPAPSKIPAGAIEVEQPKGDVLQYIRLDIDNALCRAKWESGKSMESFVAANENTGWIRFKNFSIDDLHFTLIPPSYNRTVDSKGDNSHAGSSLIRLGYGQGIVKSEKQKITYHQPCWNGFYYDIAVTWRQETDSTVVCAWSITCPNQYEVDKRSASVIVDNAVVSGYDAYYKKHSIWWKIFWNQSSIHLPDSLLERQWYLEQYKFGSVARSNMPPISLQAVWTADNDLLPPWKGDYHHDLNTELSYWSSYSANHLDLAMGFVNHIEKNIATYKKYTKRFFKRDGIAIPGVTTLNGTEMGGWVQYSLSPTVASWVSQHYYWQWKYSNDNIFLKNKAYPWLKDVCLFLEQITNIDASGYRQLSISSSPEWNNNALNAWFTQTTNYDNALMQFAFSAAAEMAQSLGLPAASTHYEKILHQFPLLAKDSADALMIATGESYHYSHRHFSHMMSIYPLGQIKWENGLEDQKIINTSLETLRRYGPSGWCGYSYAWLGNLYARAKNGDSAANALQIFAKAFCLSNSFHANGDQTHSGYSGYTYRPFTLEGNFAFASGIQEMLLQSYNGYIDVFPAVPTSWKNVSFRQLRAIGAVLVDAEIKNGAIVQINLTSETGGDVAVKLPKKGFRIIGISNKKYTIDATQILRYRQVRGGKVQILFK